MSPAENQLLGSAMSSLTCCVPEAATVHCSRSDALRAHALTEPVAAEELLTERRAAPVTAGTKCCMLDRKELLRKSVSWLAYAVATLGEGTAVTSTPTVSEAVLLSCILLSAAKGLAAATVGKTSTLPAFTPSSFTTMLAMMPETPVNWALETPLSVITAMTVSPRLTLGACVGTLVGCDVGIPVGEEGEMG